MACGSRGIGADRGRQSVGGFVLVAEVAAYLKDVLVCPRTLCAAVENYRDLAQTGLYGGRGMAKMEFERRTAHHRAVGITRLDTQIFGDLQARQAAPGTGHEKAVHIGFFEPGIGQGRDKGFGLEAQDSRIRHDPETDSALRLWRRHASGSWMFPSLSGFAISSAIASFAYRVASEKSTPDGRMADAGGVFAK